ncbi:MAG: threonine synthase [Chloroflexota bacterium]
MSFLTHLECPETGEQRPADREQHLSTAGFPLLARYDYAGIKASVPRHDLRGRRTDLWRFRELLPSDIPVTLGEGWTPLLDLKHIAAELNLGELRMKDEGLNPTGTFKARGAAVGVARARDLGVTHVAMPTAGNAGGAWAAYCAAAGLQFRVIMPADAPIINMVEARVYGGHASYVDGLISDAGRLIGQESAEHGWYDASTLKEPYRIEGKKTMGLEIAEQCDWDLPDVIFYPAGGGVGLIGLWKAFDELEAIGWIDHRRPRLVAVQADGCAPLVRAWSEGAEECRFWDGATTIASGLRVPKPLGDRLALRAMRETNGTALAVSDRAIRDAVMELATREGLFICPEGASMLPALRALRAGDWIKPGERVILLNTGTGLKYPELVSLDGVDTIAGR